METQKKTCTACKVICVCCFCGIGAYLIQTGRSYQRNSKLLINLLGIGMTTHIFKNINNSIF